MTQAEFAKQVLRLKSQWSNAYGDERLNRIWEVFGRQLPNDVFTEMVDIALDSMRAAPLADDFGKLEEEVRKRRAGSRFNNELAQVGVLQPLVRAARKNDTADQEFVKRCLDWSRQYMAGKVGKKEFYEGCDVLDQLADTINPSGKPRSRFVGKEYKPYRED